MSIIVSNERRQKLRKILKGTFENAPLTIEELGKLLGVSARTVRYDLEVLERDNEMNGIRLCRKTGKGVWMETIGREGSALVTNAVIWSRKERCQAIIVELLDKECSSIDDLAESLTVSRNTLLQDLKSVQNTLEKRNLQYYSKRGLGIWAAGDEQSVRDMLIHIFAKILYDFRRFGETEKCLCEEYLFRRYAAGVPIKEIAAVFLKHMKKRGILENDVSINRMICALIVQCKRLQQGNFIDLGNPVNFVSDEGERLRELAKELADELCRYGEGVILENEIQYIIKELLHSRIYLFSDKKYSLISKDINLMALSLARKFVKYVQLWLGDIYIEDEELIYNLALHLQPAIERGQAGINFTNPLLPEIQKQYADLFMIAKKAAEELYGHMKIRLSEDEIGYLTIHLGGAVERRKVRESKKLAVLLVCGNGVGTANLLAVTLKNYMPYIQIIKIVSLYKLQEDDLSEVDIVISTVDLDIKEKAVLRVSPILTNTEIEIISSQIQYFYNKKFTPEFQPVSVVKKLCLADVLNEDVIALDEEAVDWRQGVRLAGKLLEKNGAVDSSYTEQMVACIDKLGSYVVVCPGVAMPHARVEDGVKRVAVSFLRLKNGVDFSRQHSAVDMIFAFSTIDEKAHLQIMHDLWEVFTDKKALHYLRKAKTKQEILRFIQQFGK